MTGPRQHLARWRYELESGTVAADLHGARVARKTLLPVAGLVSVHDNTWTTGRSRAVQPWSGVQLDLAVRLGHLLSWADGERAPAAEEVRKALAGDGIVGAIVERFAHVIGLWADDPNRQWPK